MSFFLQSEHGDRPIRKCRSALKVKFFQETSQKQEKKGQIVAAAVVVADFKTFVELVWDFYGHYSLGLTTTTLLKLWKMGLYICQSIV